MSEMDRTPWKTVKWGGNTMKVKYVMDVGGKSGDSKWEPYPINVLMATYDEHLHLYDERKEKGISTNAGRKAELAKNQANPLPDLTEEECKELLRKYYRKHCPKMTDGDIEEALKNVTYVQYRDKNTQCRVLEAEVTRRFIWGTNIVLNIEEDKAAKKLLEDELFKGCDDKTNPAKRSEARNKLNNFLGLVIQRGRGRWAILYEQKRYANTFPVAPLAQAS